MGALSGLIAHGGVAGAIIESLLAIAVVGVFGAVWLRERRGGSKGDGPARLRDDEDDRGS